MVAGQCSLNIGAVCVWGVCFFGREGRGRNRYGVVKVAGGILGCFVVELRTTLICFLWCFFLAIAVPKKWREIFFRCFSHHSQ